MAIRVYEFGLLPPTTNGALVDEQMYKNHRYRNVLVEIERERRTKCRAVMAGHPDTTALAAELEELVKQRDAAREEIMRKRQKTRSRKDTPEERELVRKFTVPLRELRDRLKEAKRKVAEDPAIREGFQRAEDEAKVRIKKARAENGVYWGTYLLAEQAHDAARKSKTDPHFVRWNHEGRVSVQLQGGLEVDKLFGNDTQIQITPIDEAAWSQGTPRGVRRRLTRTVLKMRVGSDGRAPIWASWPMIMHRPIPAGSVIKVATVSQRYQDCRTYRWVVQMTVDVPDGQSGRCGDGAIALNVGWWQRPDQTIRAGFLTGEDGQTFEAIVDRSVTDRIEKASSLLGFRDRDVNIMRPLLTAWLRDNENILPPWLVQKCILDREEKKAYHVQQWTSARRFRALAFLWREQRFEGDEAGYQLIEKWRYRDEHLERYEQGVRRQALGHRREQYRILAAKLSLQYRTLVIDDTDLRVLQVNPSPESENINKLPLKRQMRAAATSELRLIFINAFKRAGNVVKVSHMNVSRGCSHCGELMNPDAERTVICPGCARSWDQDHNACLNMLKSAKTDQVIEAEKKASRSERFKKRYAKEEEAAA